MLNLLIRKLCVKPESGKCVKMKKPTPGIEKPKLNKSVDNLNKTGLYNIYAFKFSPHALKINCQSFLLLSD